MRVEGFYTSCPPSFEPLTHRSFAHSQGDRNIFLSPSGFFQFPGAFAPFFSPIGFLWCSHASYSSTLYLLPPRSVKLRSAVSISTTSHFAKNANANCRMWGREEQFQSVNLPSSLALTPTALLLKVLETFFINSRSNTNLREHHPILKKGVGSSQANQQASSTPRNERAHSRTPNLPSRYNVSDETTS